MQVWGMGLQGSLVIFRFELKVQGSGEGVELV